MLRESFRSAVYRSFVACDDPKGVVECGTITKSKSSEDKLENKTTSHRKQKKSVDPSVNHSDMFPKRVEKECYSPSSIQLLEVSRGAKKLNQMSDSWSKGLRYEGQPKEIAKDLLKGALDLQDSLVMLRKLQEASKYMSKLKKKQEEKIETHRFGFKQCTNQAEFQKPRLSADESSRDCYDELREVIQESFARQNLLSNSHTAKESYYHQRNLDKTSDIPSTSSSQSSKGYTTSFDSADSSRLSACSQKKVKPPNLIARLMGIEEVSTENLQPTSRKFDWHKPLLDIEMPRVKRPEYAVKKVDTEQKTLREVLETMQFKGLLKRDFVKEIDNTLPPIVLIKPARVPCIELEEQLGSSLHDEGTPETEKIVSGYKLRDYITIKQRKPKEEEKTVKTTTRNEKPKDHKVMNDKPGERKAEKVGRSVQAKVSSPRTNHPPKKKSTDEKVNQSQKVKSSSRKVVEKDSVKSHNGSGAQCQPNVIAAKIRDPRNSSKVVKNETPQPPRSSTISKPSARSTIGISNNQKKKKMSAREPATATLVVDDSKGEENKNSGDMTSNHDSLLVETTVRLDDVLPPSEEETEPFKFQISAESPDDKEDSIGNSIIRACDSEKDKKTDSESIDYINVLKPCNTNVEAETNLKTLILRSPSSLNHAEELLAASVFNSAEVADARLLLDYAKELIVCKGLRKSQKVHPLLLIRARALTTHTAKDQLVEEIYRGFETLRGYYNKLCGEKLATDNTNMILERDLRGTDMANGMWTVGWEYAFSADEAEQVVNQMETLLLSELINEVFI